MKGDTTGEAKNKAKEVKRMTAAEVSAVVQFIQQGGDDNQLTVRQKALLQRLHRTLKESLPNEAIDTAVTRPEDKVLLGAHILKALEEVDPAGKKHALLPIGRLTQRPMALHKFQALKRGLAQAADKNPTLTTLRNRINEEEKKIETNIKAKREEKKKKEEEKKAKKEAAKRAKEEGKAPPEEEKKEDEEEDDVEEGGVNAQLLNFFVREILAARFVAVPFAAPPDLTNEPIETETSPSS